MLPPDSSAAPSVEPVAEAPLDKERELRRLRVFQQDASGFRLGLAVFTYPKERDQLLARLRESLSSNRVRLSVLDVSAAPAESTLLDLVRAHREQEIIPEGWREALHLVGLESRLAFQLLPGASDDPGLSFFAEANLHRESLARACPEALILWLTESASLALGKAAADLWHWRSASFDFTTEQSSTGGEQGLLRATETEPIAPDACADEVQRLERELTAMGATRADESPQHLAQRIDLLLRLGTTYRDCVRLNESQRALNSARELAVRIHDEQREARACGQLGYTLYCSARFTEAEPLLRRALAINEKCLGPQHTSIAHDLNNLALLLNITNRMAEAEPLCRRALAISEQSYRPEHPEVATLLNNLALLLRETNRLAEAEPLFRRALAINETNHGPDHPDVATSLNNLARLLTNTNRLAEAEPLFRRSLAIDEQNHGPDHPNVAKRLNNLALLLQATNRMDEAEPLFRRSLAIDEQNHGPDHPKVATRLYNLAFLLKDTDRRTEAVPLFKRAVDIMVRSLGADHPNTRIVVANAKDAGLLK